MKFVGIDPGLDGGISVIETFPKKARTVSIYDVPTISEIKKKKGKDKDGNPKQSLRRKYDMNAIVDIFKTMEAGEADVVIEYAGAMPGQGVVSMFTIGLGYGMYQGILSAERLSFTIVHSRRWQDEFRISGDTKAQAFQIAGRLYPEAVLASPRGRIYTGRCDSLLMAEYGRRKYTGTLEG